MKKETAMKKIAIIISDYNEEITKIMLSTASATAKKLGIEVSDTIHVPGALEIPFAMKNLIESKKSGKKIDGIVALGAVIQGDTDHDIVVAHNCAALTLELSLKHNIPLGFGVMGPRVKYPQAKAKAKEYSGRAVETVAEMINRFSRK